MLWNVLASANRRTSLTLHSNQIAISIINIIATIIAILILIEMAA